MSTNKKMIVANLPTSDLEFVEKVKKASKSGDLFDLVLGFPEVENLPKPTDHFSVAIPDGCSQVLKIKIVLNSVYAPRSLNFRS